MPPPQPVDLLEHLDDVRLWCLMRSGDPHLAEDVTQETALAALRRLDSVREPSSLRGWLFRIAERRLTDSRRRGGPLYLPLLAEPLAPASHGPGDDDAGRKAVDARVKRVLRRLPQGLRQAVRMHYLQGRPIREVARRLETTVNGVKARLYRARRVLREVKW